MAADPTRRAAPPLVVLGRLGWANGDRSPIPRPQFDAYGPGGRWGQRSAGDNTGRVTHGDHLADALTDAGAGEGDRLLVLVLPRDTPDEVVRRLADWVLAMGTPPSQLHPGAAPERTAD